MTIEIVVPLHSFPDECLVEFEEGLIPSLNFSYDTLIASKPYHTLMYAQYGFDEYSQESGYFVQIISSLKHLNQIKMHIIRSKFTYKGENSGYWFSMVSSKFVNEYKSQRLRSATKRNQLEEEKRLQEKQKEEDIIRQNLKEKELKQKILEQERLTKLIREEETRMYEMRLNDIRNRPTQKRACFTCSGTGEVETNNGLLDGYMSYIHTCSDCHGTGLVDL